MTTNKFLSADPAIRHFPLMNMQEITKSKADLSRHRYDLINVTMIWLDDKSYQKKLTDLHGYLGTIFAAELTPQEKIRILEEEYGAKPTRKMRGGLYRMCNLGDAIEARGIRKGEKIGEKRGEKRGRALEKNNAIIRSVNNAMSYFHVDLHEACKSMGYTVDAYTAAKKTLEQPII